MPAAPPAARAPGRQRSSTDPPQASRAGPARPAASAAVRDNHCRPHNPPPEQKQRRGRRKSIPSAQPIPHAPAYPDIGPSAAHIPAYPAIGRSAADRLQALRARIQAQQPPPRVNFRRVNVRRVDVRRVNLPRVNLPRVMLPRVSLRRVMVLGAVPPRVPARQPAGGEICLAPRLTPDACLPLAAHAARAPSWPARVSAGGRGADSSLARSWRAAPPVLEYIYIYIVIEKWARGFSSEILPKIP